MQNFQVPLRRPTLADCRCGKRRCGSFVPKTTRHPRLIGHPGPTPFTRDPQAAIPANVPPSFLVCAGSGDRVHALWADDYFRAMLMQSVPNLEMRIYGRGKHGGSIGARDGIPFGTWSDRFIDWFRDLGFLGKSGTETQAAKDVADFAKRRAQRSGRN